MPSSLHSEEPHLLADELAALRRVATLVARGLPPTEIFAAVAEETGRLVAFDGTRILRFEADRTATVIAGWSESIEGPRELEIGARLPLEGEGIAARVFRTGRPARIDHYASAAGPLSEALQEVGVQSAAGAPIIVEGRLWGVIVAGSTRPEPLPSGIELRLAQFTELVAAAIVNADSRAGLARLAEEQAALRRVATLVARGAPSEEVFAAVTKELGRLIDADIASMIRFESGNTAILVAASIKGEDDRISPLSLGAPVPLDNEGVPGMVLRTGRASRWPNLEQASDSQWAAARQLGITSAVGTPIVVEGRLWGEMAVSSRQPEPLPADTESRIADFAELVATAIANADARTELTASRARLLTAADEARRQIERDLHDGTQQRLVSLGLELRLAESAVAPELEETRTTIRRVADELSRVIDELREISRGIHPAILAEGGLGPALRTLARRSAIPVVLGEVVEERLPEPIEVAAYYVVSEALTNTAKHAQASAVHVNLARVDRALHISVRDDGVGGADQARGSGLVGLRDRVEALGGTLVFQSAKGAGTTVEVILPLDRLA